jgi:hypothetical protein
MGFKQRERKRKRRAAQAAAQRQSRRASSAAAKHSLTVVTQTTCCARCGLVLRVGCELVYRHRPGEALCLPCADRAGVSYRPSLRWDERRRQAVRHVGA